MFSSDLKVTAQCKEVVSIANRIFGLINRTIRNKNLVTLINLYKSMVRPHLELFRRMESSLSLGQNAVGENPTSLYSFFITSVNYLMIFLTYEGRLSQLRLGSLEERIEQI